MISFDGLTLILAGTFAMTGFIFSVGVAYVIGGLKRSTSGRRVSRS